MELHRFVSKFNCAHFSYENYYNCDHMFTLYYKIKKHSLCKSLFKSLSLSST